MIPYQTDPTLHDREPVPVQLDDGFSPPSGGSAEADGAHADDIAREGPAAADSGSAS